MITRRGFLQSCIALAAAPAIVRADSLMRIVPRGAAILNPGASDRYPWEIPGALILDREFVLQKPATFAVGVMAVGCRFTTIDNFPGPVLTLSEDCALINSTIEVWRR